MIKERKYYFVGKIKDLLKDLELEIEMQFDKEIEEGFRENLFCDNYGYCCGLNCKNYYNCKE